VVGFNSYVHLKEIIVVFKKKQIETMRNFSSNNFNLVELRSQKIKKFFNNKINNMCKNFKKIVYICDNYIKLIIFLFN
jgi:hypothetical protein